MSLMRDAYKELSCDIHGKNCMLVEEATGKKVCLTCAKEKSAYAGCLCIQLNTEEKKGDLVLHKGIVRSELPILKTDVNLEHLKAIGRIQLSNGVMFYTTDFIPSDVLSQLC
jgi:hypothetical protein